ncbi:hypothetical protein CYMTET_26963 [Cymbomonas tetramitiformis]|uniref:Uncharacterized protein n=1 Tax=Cymbomonas tetramitiformis TaxID=36881 RepID=A0AAE0KXG8_9CHLO|nr:hypothetical protein CYMTET_26963 [Cymbomonas tetramitiformis]
MAACLEKIEAALKHKTRAGRGLGRSAEQSAGNYHEYRDCPFGGKGAGSGTAAFCMPVDDEDGAETMHTLALCHNFQVAANDGADAFATAVQHYGAPAVIADDQGTGGVEAKAMEEKVGVSFAQTSLVVDDDASTHDEPAGAFCGSGALAPGVPQQVVSGAAEGTASASQVASSGAGRAEMSDHEIRARVSAAACGPRPTGYFMASIAAPTEEFAGLRLHSAVGHRHGSFGLTLFFSLASSLCFCFGIVGAAAGYGGAVIDNEDFNSVTNVSPVMCIGQLCLYPGFDSLSPVVQEQLLQVVGSAAAAAAQCYDAACTSAAASGYGGTPDRQATELEVSNCPS